MIAPLLPRLHGTRSSDQAKQKFLGCELLGLRTSKRGSRYLSAIVICPGGPIWRYRLQHTPRYIERAMGMTEVNRGTLDTREAALDYSLQRYYVTLLDGKIHVLCSQHVPWPWELAASQSRALISPLHHPLARSQSPPQAPPGSLSTHTGLCNLS